MNSNYLIFDSITNLCIRKGSCPASEIAHVPLSENEVIELEPETFSPFGWEYVNNQVVPRTSNFISLEAEKEYLWEEIKIDRDTHLSGTIVTPLGEVDCDNNSRINISGAVQMAFMAKLNGQPFSMDWTMADNTVITLNADQLIEMGVSVASFVNETHSYCRSLRDKIDQATNQADLEVIKWNS